MRMQLAEFGGHVHLNNRHWARSLLKFVRRKATTARNKKTKDFNERKKQFLSRFAATVTMEDIPPELIIN